MNGLFKALVEFGPDLWKATLDTLLMVSATMASAFIREVEICALDRKSVV